MWSRAYGPWQLGLAYNFLKLNRLYARDGSAEEEAIAAEALDQSLGLGVRRGLASRLYLDVAGETTFHARQYEQDLAGLRFKQDDSWQTFAVRARAFYGAVDWLALVPMMEHVKDVLLTYSPALADVADLDARITRVGLGLNIFPDSDNLLLASWEYRWQEHEVRGAGTWGAAYQAQRERTDGYVLRLGLESRVMPWLSLRAAARQEVLERTTRLQLVESLKDSVADPASLPSDPELDLTLGLAFHFGAFAADCLFSDKAPFSLASFLTGADGSTDSTFTSLTLTYAF
jgi:hypothetical protein